MTYCLAIRLEDGLVFGSDTRTSAGVDYVTSYRKLHVFAPAADRLFVVLSAGNLATTQEVLHWVTRDLDADDGRPSLANVKYLFEAAHYLGQVSRAVQDQYTPAMSRSGISGETSLILGGQITGKPHDIFLIYPQGNFVEASADTPYLQIGESKYGKPMLDRLSSHKLTLEDAARLALVSLDATIKSNVTVGAPVDLAVYKAGSLKLSSEMRLHADSPFYMAVKEKWQQGITDIFRSLPLFEGEKS